MNYIKFITILLYSIFISTVIYANVVINEVQYSNSTSHTDKSGKTPDWIEIYNAGTADINLKGYFLTDNLQKSNYWSFPNITIQKGDFVLVFASGKDVKDPQELHCNFKLKVMQESVYLLSPQKKIIDSIAKQCVPKDKSISRIPDGSSSVFVSTPSPQRSNNQSAKINTVYIPDTLIANIKGGHYQNTINLQLQNEQQSNIIYYTTDGTNPDERSLRYQGSITIEDKSNDPNVFANMLDKEAFKPGNIHKGTVVKAQVYSAGCPASRILTDTYFIGKNPFKTKYTISIVTDKDNLFDDKTGIYVKGDYDNYFQRGKDWERDAFIEIFDSSNQRIISQETAIRLHGNSTRTADQKSFKLYADEYFEYPLFHQKPHLKSFKTLMLKRSNSITSAFMNDELSNHIVDNMNIDYCATETVLVYINGEYWGIYSLRERQDKGYLKNNHSLFNETFDIITYNIEDIKVEEGSDNKYFQLLNYLENNAPEDDTFYEEVGELIDIENTIDYFIAQFYFANSDFPNNNLRMWAPQGDSGKWRYLFYDLDYGMRWVNDDLFAEYTIKEDSYQKHPEFSTTIFKALLANKAFQDQFYARFLMCLNGSLKSDNVIALIEDFEKKYNPIIPDHINRWHASGDHYLWESSVDKLRSYALQRPLYLKKQLYNTFGAPFIITSDNSSKKIAIQFIGEGNAQIKIINTQGQILLNDSYPCNEVYETNHDFTPGIYIVQIQIGNNTFAQKLIL